MSLKPVPALPNIEPDPVVAPVADPVEPAPVEPESARPPHVPELMQASIDKSEAYAALGRFVALYFNDSAEPGKTNEDILRELAHLEQFRVLLNKAR